MHEMATSAAVRRSGIPTRIAQPRGMIGV
jgi:hypothetical protein